MPRRPPQRHLSASGKLDGVGQQIHDDLPQARGVPNHRSRHIGRDVANQFEILFVGAKRPLCGALLDAVAQVELHVHVELARFDLGEIQNVVDDGQQRIRGGFDHASIPAVRA